MFTGIIEEMGRLTGRSQAEGHEVLIIEAKVVLEDLKTGHSIAINGVCLTVIGRTKKQFTVQVIPETMALSNLGDLAIGDQINLERAMGVSDRFHGHVVQGHVETVGVINHISDREGDVRVTVTIDHEWLRYCLPKGSIAIDGVSLTVTNVSSAGVTMALIPHTLALTTLGHREVGDTVNIETDIFARYLEKFWDSEMEEEQGSMVLGRGQHWGIGES